MVVIRDGPIRRNIDVKVVRRKRPLIVRRVRSRDVPPRLVPKPIDLGPHLERHVPHYRAPLHIQAEPVGVRVVPEPGRVVRPLGQEISGRRAAETVVVVDEREERQASRQLDRPEARVVAD